MFGTVIKNTVLFILIILILHFMINNILVELKLLNKKSPKQEEPQVHDLDYPKPSRKQDDTSMTTELIPKDTPCNTNVNNIKMKELYDFVYDKDAKPELNKFFKDDIDFEKNNENVPEIRCADNLNDNVGNYCSSSPTSKEEITGHYSNFNREECDKDIDQTKGVYILKKYKNEQEVNGGKLEGTDLEAFDGYDSLYETY
jgi:hypothetical protein